MFWDIISLAAAYRMVMEECLTSHGALCCLKSHGEKILRRRCREEFYRQYCNFTVIFRLDFNIHSKLCILNYV